jgi:hypothetical protein
LECAEPNPQGFSTCLHFGDEGDSCSGTYERCVFGTECVAGKCQARDSLGVFATTCK